MLYKILQSFKYLGVPIQAKTTLAIVVDCEGGAVSTLGFKMIKKWTFGDKNR